MSWEDSDDDWENEPAEDAKKDTEMTIDDLEEAERKKKEAEAAALAAKAPKKDKKKEKDEEKKPEDVAYDVALNDPVAEKLRRQKLVEEADARMAKDLFSGIAEADESIEEQKKEEEAEKEKKEEEEKRKKEAKKAEIQVIDEWDKVELKVQENVDLLLKNCLEKVEAAKAKGAAHLWLTHLVKALEPALTSEELIGLEKRITEIVKSKKLAATTAKVDKKAETKVSKNTKFDIGKAFAESKYGNDDDWDEDWEDDWYDDGTSAAYAPPKK